MVVFGSADDDAVGLLDFARKSCHLGGQCGVRRLVEHGKVVDLHQFNVGLIGEMTVHEPQ